MPCISVQSMRAQGAQIHACMRSNIIRVAKNHLSWGASAGRVWGTLTQYANERPLLSQPPQRYPEIPPPCCAPVCAPTLPCVQPYGHAGGRARARVGKTNTKRREAFFLFYFKLGAIIQP